MGMVANSRGPRPCTLHARFTTAFVVLLATANLAAQDRVVLFDRPVGAGTLSPLPFELREFDIMDGGRTWSFRRTTTLPGHSAGTPVVLADGSCILWLASTNYAALLVHLVQYELATGRASVVNVGPFQREATLVADPAALRVAIVEPHQVTFIDQRLQPYSVAIGPLAGEIAVADGYVVVQRTVFSGAEAVVINSSTAEIVRSIPLPGHGRIRSTRDAQRLYYASGVQMEIRSLVGGQVLARATTNATGEVQLFELDESRGILVHSVRLPDNRRQIVGRDASTLALLGELGFGLYNSAMGFQLKATRNERAILVFSQGFASTGRDLCEERGPRIDMFDGRTLTLLRQIATVRCTNVLPVPPR